MRTRKGLAHTTAVWSLAVGALLPLVAAWAGRSAEAQSPVQAHLQQAILANSLDSAGKVPFHLKIVFQLYDLAGNASDTGFAEEWWAAPGLSRITVSAGSLKTPEPVLLNDDLAMDPREKYLVRKLLNSAVHPIAASSPSFLASAKEVPQKFDTTTLTCFGIAGDQVSGTGMGQSRYCTDSSTYALRMQLEGQLSTTARNALATFHDTHVSMAIDIAYDNLQAISGKVTVLHSFDPAKSDIVLLSSPVPKEERTSIVQGRSLERKSPELPPIARSSHLSGSVVLHAIISKQGTIKDLFALAGRNPSLTQAAIDAVQRWTYTPSKLNGQPVDVDTTVTVNFNYGSVSR